MPVIVHEPYLAPRSFDTIGKAKDHMRKKVKKQMEFCRKFANDSVIAVGDLAGAVEELNDGSFEHGPVELAACVDTHSGARMRFLVEKAS